VPIGFTLHSWRRPVVLIAAWLVVIQAFLTGVATAQSAAMLAADPTGGTAVICHGGGGTDPAEPAAPGSAWHLCCAYCTSTAPALPPITPIIVQSWTQHVAELQDLARFTVIAARGAVRAGPSQAPPGQA
jgi:hypothetical protein